MDNGSGSNTVGKGTEVQVVLPVHNEAASIQATVAEIAAALSATVNVSFIFSEDGSADGTPEVLALLAQEDPRAVLISEPRRKGYSRAVMDALAQVTAPWVLCLDSDGQCDPADFAAVWQKRMDADVVIGWRVARQDTALRKTLSGTFKLLFGALFHVPVHDPSCPFVLTTRRVAQSVLPDLGVLSQGFWWEFVARVHARGYSVVEVPVHHRARAAGETQVYRLNKLPGIGLRHTLGLLQIWSECRRLAPTHQNA